MKKLISHNLKEDYEYADQSLRFKQYPKNCLKIYAQKRVKKSVKLNYRYDSSSFKIKLEIIERFFLQSSGGSEFIF